MPPRFIVDAPVEGLLTNSTEIVVEGRVHERSLTLWIDGARQNIVDNRFSDKVRLPEGPKTIRVRARDLAGNEWTILRNITLDTIPPELYVDFLRDHHLTREQVLTVTGRSEPGATVTIGSLQVTVSTDGTFDLEVTLEEGDNPLAIFASDPAGNRETVYRFVVLDTIPPMLTIEEPEDGLLTKDNSVRVAGLVGNEEGTVLSVGGSFVLPVDGHYEYTVSITEGENIIVVTAIDAAGNQAEANRTIIRRTQPPILEITRPEYDYMVTNEVNYRIEGITEVDVGITVAGTMVSVDEEGIFEAFVQLITGENVISVVASDTLGNRAERVVRLILDTEPPSLIIEFPMDGYVTEEDNVTILGRTDVGAILAIDGIEVSINDKGRYEQDVDLKMGRQALNVTSTDQAGNEATVTLNLERVTPEEPIEPTTPPSAGGSTVAILVAILVLAIAGGVGWMYFQQRRKNLQE